MTDHELDIHDHDRASAGLTYVYPVVSRRAGGVSVGINLNPNNACNFRCIYCQVPGLVSGNAPTIDVPLLGRELDALLGDIVRGDFMERRVDPSNRRLNDIALSGNGEPTTCRQFAEVVDVVGAAMEEFDLVGRTKLILITNGTATNRSHVEDGIRRMAGLGGEVWFKLDSATEEGAARVNQSRAGLEQRFGRLARVAELCPTFLQTCVFLLDGEPPSETECGAYVEALQRLSRSGVSLRGVLLYGLARPSQQPEAPRLAALSKEWLQAYAERIRAGTGLEVRVTP